MISLFGFPQPLERHRCHYAGAIANGLCTATPGIKWLAGVHTGNKSAMCGRLHVRAADVTALLVEFLELIHQGPDNLNAAPTEEISVLVSDTQGAISLQPMRRWLTPSWAKQPSTRYSMFNAKAETAANLPSFREPYSKASLCGACEWLLRVGSAART